MLADRLGAAPPDVLADGPDDGQRCLDIKLGSGQRPG